MGRPRRLAALSGLVLAAPLVLTATGSSAGAADAGLPAPPPATAPALPTDSCATYEGGDTICSGSVPSFDGSPLDFDVTLPANNSPGPHPLIVMLHGFGNNKHEWESTTDEGDGGDKYRWNNHWFAKHGYYVLTYTARGFRDDGPTAAHQPPTPAGTAPNCAPPGGSDCAPAGTIRVKNKDVEIRDTQWLAGLTSNAFPGQIDPNQVAVTGNSYGGGESWLQAAQPDWNGFVARGLPAMRLQVAVPKYPWTDLSYALTPNGHPGPGAPGDPMYSSSAGAQESGATYGTAGEGNPFGVGKASYVAGLYTLGTTQGTFEEGNNLTPQTNGPEPFTAWNSRVATEGEPYDIPGRDDLPDGSRTLRHSFSANHSAYYQQGWAAQAESKRETAIFSISGWTDDLFEPVESFRMFNYLKSLDPRWPVAVGVGDVGHARAQNPGATWQRMNNQAFQFLQSHIGGSHQQQTGVFSEATTCAPTDAPNAARPPAKQLSAATPEGLAAGRIDVSYAGGRTLTAVSGADDPNGPVIDPIVGGAIEPVGTNTSECRAAVSPTAGTTGFTGNSAPLPAKRTYVGLGSVDVPYTAIGAPARSSAVLATRVWDVAPDGTALLVTRGVYRLDFRPGYDPVAGTARVPLFGNQWDLDPGHRIRVDLVQADVPYLRPPNPGVTADLQISSPRLTLPTRSAGATALAGTAS